ncbi:DUF4268 domain-containing protein [Sandaracinomonas limnophila]|uniref:DUF4268 domain-containing protein n=1 Tax=Sandaracinomonas limnophila TaxID=1862386 RepID=A0A437PXP4_9BACT|nr:DUF4268 domain-containing protein [Sandaracinomonas limnophila]RVU26988.1 DUF4268 domain-containing protein [Sandaracinomonas limnophila]
MYKINKLSNNVEKLEQRLFRDLNIRERQHLQEWIAKNPEMLGEDLLIIQKEFDGFNDTNERLDLLAIDKNGGLVIIENKLDDTGRDVVWQALKYASYCSTLTTSQIIKIFQSYLDKWSNNEDAKQNLLDFLEKNDDELLLNKNDQRIIFVANNYRKEVTSTVLWLLRHNIQVQCFRATPYSMSDDVFLQVEQIIPLPETKEFMIDAQEKEKEVQDKSKNIQESEQRLVKFWSQFKSKLTEQKIDYLDRVASKTEYSIGFWKGPSKFAFCLGKTNFRVELYIPNDTNKIYFDAIFRHKSEVESSFDGIITWERLDTKKASRVRFDMPNELLNKLEGKFNDEIYWGDLFNWYIDAMQRFFRAVNPVWERVLKEV